MHYQISLTSSKRGGEGLCIESCPARCFSGRAAPAPGNTGLRAALCAGGYGGHRHAIAYAASAEPQTGPEPAPAQSIAKPCHAESRRGNGGMNLRILVWTWVSISLLFPLFIEDSSASLDGESVHSTTFAKLVALLPASTLNVKNSDG